MDKMWGILWITVAALVLAGCSGIDMPDSAIVKNDRFTLTGDSLIMGDTIVYSHDGFSIKSNLKTDDGRPIEWTLSHDEKGSRAGIHTEHMLVNAISAMSASIVGNRSNLQFGTNSDLYDAIGLSLAYLDPEYSMQQLKARVKDGVVTGTESDFYPAFNNRLAWTNAAWKVYNVTGDRAWLKYAYDVSTATFVQEQDIAFYNRDWLVRGCPGDFTPLVEALPMWMGGSDVFSTFTLNNNVETAAALRIIGEMAEELGLDSKQYENMGHDLMVTTNSEMWNERHGQYTSMVYGQSCDLHAPCSDNRAQALAVLWGIADEDDRASTLIEKTAITHCGVNNFYPARNHSTDPCLAEASWGLTQGLWNLAAAHVENENALRRGMAALWRAQALYSTLIINDGSTNMDVTCAVSTMALTHRVLAGMEFDPEGIEFNPFVPSCLNGDKTITGFKYRNGTIDITVKGTGCIVDFVLLDDKRIDGNFISADKLAGHHSIIVTMNNEAPSATQGVTIATHSFALPDEPVVMWNGDSAQVLNYDPALNYKLVVDGTSSYTISDSIFALPAIDTFSEMCVIAASKSCFSYTSRPFILGGRKFQRYPIPASAEGNDSINVTINVPDGGNYMLSVNYMSPAHSSDVYIVSANTHRQGVVVMSGLGTDTISGQTNLIHVDLLRNANTITLKRTSPTGTGAPTARPLTLNIFKK